MYVTLLRRYAYPFCITFETHIIFKLEKEGVLQARCNRDEGQEKLTKKINATLNPKTREQQRGILKMGAKIQIMSC